MGGIAGIIASLFGLFGLFLLYPGPIESERFAPGPPAHELVPNRLLADGCERISEGEISHPDKLTVDDSGNVYAGDDRGRIHVLTPDGIGGYERSLFAVPRGRPMELVFGFDHLVGADHEGGHFSIDSQRQIRRLDTLWGLEQGTAGLALGSEGKLYYGAHPEALVGDDGTGFMEMLAAHQSSELRVFDRIEKKEQTLVTGLFRPVGVELSAKEDFVAVAEFWAYRVTRYWLTGPKAGTHDRLIENLPGFVDGLASDGNGTFYLTLAASPPPQLAWLHERPFWKNQLAKILPWLLRLGDVPDSGPGIVLAVDEDGRILRSFQDPDGEVVPMITTAEPHGGFLYVASIMGDWIAKCAIPSP